MIQIVNKSMRVVENFSIPTIETISSCFSFNIICDESSTLNNKNKIDEVQYTLHNDSTFYLNGYYPFLGFFIYRKINKKISASSLICQPTNDGLLKVKIKNKRTMNFENCAVIILVFIFPLN